MIKTVILFGAILLIGIFVFTFNRSISRVSSQSVSCTLQSQGDIDCSGLIDLADFEIWRKGYMARLAITPGLTGTTTPVPTGTTPTVVTPSTTIGAPSPTTAQSITPPPGASPKSETMVSFSSIPQAAQNGINAKYPNNTINRVVKRTFSNGAIDYEIELDNANGITYDVWVLPDGTITAEALA